MEKEQFRKNLKEYLTIVFMAVLLAFNYIIFIIENKFAPAGLSGVAIMLQYKLGLNIGHFTLMVNIPLTVLAMIFVNRRFALRSFLFTVAYSVAYMVLYEYREPLLGGYIYRANGIDTVLPVLAAGIVNGYIYGMTFKSNASTGGVDIIAKLISKKFPAFNFVWVIFILNVAVAVASYFVYGEPDETGRMIYDMKPVLLCIIYSFVTSRIGDFVLKGNEGGIKFEIITEHAEEICQDIFDELHHGATISTVRGVYSGKEKQHIICVINKHQLNEFKNILYKYPDAFAFVSSVDSMIGRFVSVKKRVI
ncbi:YitT family protein [bacterium]|nr:YitT family protein [bacterium]